MVRKITPQEAPIKLEGDPAGGRPLYIYFPDHKKFVLVSEDIKALLEHPETGAPLEVSPLGISFLLQSGVIPTPYTVFKNLYVLNIGDKAEILKISERLEINFSHHFPYFNFAREKEFLPDENKLLRLLGESTLQKLRSGAPTYLFQSLGKDSNTIALALAECGFHDLICLTLSTGDRKDESEVAAEIARRLGFKHQKLLIPRRLTPHHFRELEFYFENIPLPCVDGVSLAYPFYALQINFRGTNVLDGSGNDIYMGHVPRHVEFKRQKIYPRFCFLRPLADRLPSGNFLSAITRTRSEMAGPFGFTFRDTKKLFPPAIPVFPFWKKADQMRKNWDYFDLKADIWGPNLEFDLVMRKARNFAAVYGVNLIFPWADRQVAEYVKRIPERFLFDRDNFRNKLILRKILKERLGLDSDALGKFSYGFNAYGLLSRMKNQVTKEILDCSLWNPQEAEKILQKLEEGANKGKRLFRKLWVRLYLISAWYNHNRSVKR